MKIIITGLLILLGFILTTCLIETKKKKGKLTGSITNMIFPVIVATLMQVIVINTVNEKLGDFASSIYYICIDLVLYFIVLASIEYTYYEPKVSGFLNLIRIVMGVDILILLSNNFTHMMFRFVLRVEEDGLMHLMPEVYFSFFNLHLFFVFLLMGYELFVMIYAIFHLDDIYRKKYILLSLSFLSIIVCTIYDAVYGTELDITIFAYIVTALFFYYLILSYRPSIIVDKMLAHLVINEFDSILFFDNRDHCVFVNTRGKEMFGITESDLEEKDEEIANFVRNFIFDNESDINIASHGMVVNGEKKYFEVEYKKIKRGKRYLGKYYRIKDKTDYKKVLDEERYQANHDPLTGLYNREYFYERASSLLAECPDKEFYIVSTDIKGFKLINDLYGDEVGDQVLIDVANTIRDLLKGDSLYCRLTADKFCLMIEKSSFKEETLLLAQERMSYVKGKDYPIITQIGVYKVKNKKLPISVMIDRANLAISEIRDDFHRRISYYDDKIRHLRYWEQKLSGELEGAIADGQLKVFLQPQCDKDGNVLGAEALIRWEHPVEGMIPPSQFIEMFEKNGMISRVDLFVWESVAKILMRWKEMGKEHLYISVNISPIDFYFINIYEVFKNLVSQNNIDPKRMKLEITESTMMRDMDRKLKLIEDLRKIGFMMEMDDFGSGYSSLNMLKEIPVDIIKLDMGFLDRSQDKTKSYKIIEMVVNLSKELGMDIVSEGVETEEQLNFLSKIGCECFQGYYFSKPIEVEEFEKKYL